MFGTQKRFEENISVLNEQNPVRASGGIANITDSSSQTIKAVMLPDIDVHIETKKEGQFRVEKVYAHIRKTEMNKILIIPGQTRITWNGNEYVVHSIIDYTTKLFFRNAEIEMRRRLDIN